MDPEALRREYAAMTDEALLEIDPRELVPAARQCLEEELLRRDIQPLSPEDADTGYDTGDDAGDETDILEELGEWADQPAPDWIDEGFVVYGEVVGRKDTLRMRDAVEALLLADVPSYPTVTRDDLDPSRMTCELHVPFQYQMQATSVLDKTIFNPQMETDWRALFETMTDDDLTALDEDSLVGGLRDRANRLLRAWEDELLKRGLAELEANPDEPAN